MKVLAICNINEEILKNSRMEDLEEVEDEDCPGLIPFRICMDA